MTDAAFQYVFGPIPSRRLGRSLGIDLVPHKVCPYDCVYCQIGHTTDRTIRRGRYVPADAVLAELRRKLAQGVACDYITLSGAGEPTLHADLGRIIEAIKALTPIPVCVLTDGALLADPQVRSELLRADVVCPTLVAADEPTYQRIHRPAEGVHWAAVLDGLCAFRREYAGAIWLEVFLVAGVNDDPPHLRAMQAVIETIRPDRIDINTAVRPPTDPDVRPSSPEAMAQACAIFGPTARIVAGEFVPPVGQASKPVPPSTETSAGTKGATATGAMAAAPRQPCPITPDDVLAALRRHPSTLDDLAASLNCPGPDLQAIVAALLADGQLILRRQGPQEFLHCP